jgi:hypothetical protein
MKKYIAIVIVAAIILLSRPAQARRNDVIVPTMKYTPTAMPTMKHTPTPMKPTPTAMKPTPTAFVRFQLPPVGGTR